MPVIPLRRRTSTRVRRMICAAVVATGILSVTGCDTFDTMSNGFEHSQATAAALERTLGRRPLVGFNWRNGSLTRVTVTFDGVPAERTLDQITEQSRAAVQTHFAQRPGEIVVAFTLAP